MAATRHTGVLAAVYILYLLIVGLNLTSVWYAVRKCVHLLLPWFVSKPTQPEFVARLVLYLRPNVTHADPVPDVAGDVRTGRVSGGCIVLCNHVNWSDFVLDTAFVRQGVYVSRSVLKIVFFPGSLLRDWLFGDMIYFKRGDASAKAALYEAVVAKCNAGRSVIVYAEGTRNPRREKMPLRVGLIKLAYEKRIPLYISFTSNKYDIFDEKRLLVTLSAAIVNRKSPVLYPADFADLASFITQTQHEWDTLWDELVLPPDATKKVR